MFLIGESNPQPASGYADGKHPNTRAASTKSILGRLDVVYSALPLTGSEALRASVLNVIGQFTLLTAEQQGGSLGDTPPQGLAHT